MSNYLQLGDVTFQDFELPSRIRFGGAQRLAVHMLPGGARVIDAMGRDDADIEWSGAFSGADAAQRARSLDQMRVDGYPLTLAWDAFRYQVVIDWFEAGYEHANWVPYQISCKVVQDLSRPVQVVSASVLTGVLGDLGAIGVIDTAAAVAALGVGGALSAGSAAYAGAVSAVGGIVSAAQNGLSRAGAALMAATDPASAAAAAGQAASYADAGGYAGRALANLDDLGDLGF